jgi:PAS domain S-box-containing protein
VGHELRRSELSTGGLDDEMSIRSQSLEWRRLPRAARVYVAAVLVAGTYGLVECMPLARPDPVLFAALLMTSCLTSAWKVNLPIPLASGSTLSVSYAANLTALLLLGPRPAVIIAVAGVWTQCTFKVKRGYPIYRTAFSMSAQVITMWATAWAYGRFGGVLAPRDFDVLAKPLVAAIATYFAVNTGLVAQAIAGSTRQSFWKIWHDDFLWSGSSFIVAGTTGAIAAVVIARGTQFKALLMLAPVYLIYRTYQTIVGRLDDQRRHLEQTRTLHGETISALAQARRAEQALTDEKERLAVMLRSIADGVIATDTDGTVILINSVAETMTGWTRETAIGRPLASVFQNVDLETRTRCESSAAALSSEAEGPGPRSGIRRCTLLVARDLTERPIEESTAPLRDNDGRVIGMVLAFRDISSALKVQEERAKASKLSALGLLAGGMGHDFNNILQAIMGNLSLARTAVPGPGAAATALTEAEHACLRARQLTWQLLTFSRGGMPMRRSVKLAHLVEESVNIALLGSNVAYTLHIDPDLWAVEADGAQLVEVFSNVLANAQEGISPGGTIAIRAENVVESHARSAHSLPVGPGRYVRVSIADSGIGIRPEHLGRIFDPYFSTKPGGSGLGLATTHSIVKNHGGFIEVQSQPGLGTTMSINVPASAVETTVVEPRPDEEVSMRMLTTANMPGSRAYQVH